MPAAHARAQIRQALVTRLTGLATTGARVYAHRYHQFADNELPGLRVFADSEDREGEYAGGRQQRRVNFTVEACAKDLTTIENTLDQIALEVEIAIATEPTLGGLAMGGVKYEGVGDFSVDHDGEKPVGVWPLRFSAQYDVDAKTPNVIA